MIGLEITAKIRALHNKIADDVRERDKVVSYQVAAGSLNDAAKTKDIALGMWDVNDQLAQLLDEIDVSLNRMAAELEGRVDEG